MNIPSRNHNLELYAAKLLKNLGIYNPNRKQIIYMKNLISHIGLIFFEMKFDKKLTKQQIHCLFWVARGKNTNEIAKEMKISASTVKTYFERIKQKLECKTIAQAIFVAIQYCFLLPNFENED